MKKWIVFWVCLSSIMLLRAQQESVNVMETIEIAPKTFDQLKVEPIRGTIYEIGDKDHALDPNKFYIDIEVENGFMFEDPKISFEGEVIVLDLRPRGDWCECLFPKDVNLQLISTPKEGAFEEEGKQFIKTVNPVHFVLEKNHGWFSRCFWILATIVALLLFAFYLQALLKKNRFRKSARIKYTFMEMKGSVVRETGLNNGPKLREKGFVPWLKRWLVPFVDETRTILWTVPPAGSMTYVAGKSRNKVYFTKESFVPNKMQMGKFDPQQNKEKLVEMDDVIKVLRERRYQGRLEFDSGNKNDEKYYRLVVTILMILSIVAALALIVLMIKSLL